VSQPQPRIGVLRFPGACDDRDALWALAALDAEAVFVWHTETALPDIDAVVLPGGFSYGDYLRCGAMASCSPVMDAVRGHAAAGGLVLGICNGFQVLCEAGLLPGALVRNRSLSFVCDLVTVRVETVDTPFTEGCRPGEVLALPIKHGEGCWVADEQTLAGLERDGRIVFRYVDRAGRVTPEACPNGAVGNVAGVCSEGRNVVGLMPHPEHAVERQIGYNSEDGLKLFRSAQAWLRRGRPQAERPALVPGP
jgi:phosphoribosylformylglycinamidine synthase I